MNRRCLFLPLVFAVATVRADQLKFRSGGQIDGVIVGETASDVTIKTGPGNATFKKSMISSIYRDAPESNAKMETAWRSEDFSNPEFLPAALRQLALDYRVLGSKKDAAVAAQRKAAQARALDASDEAELKLLQARRGGVVLKLPDPKSQAEVAAYNQQVQAGNEIVNRMNALNLRRSQMDEIDAAAHTSFSAYISALNKFRGDLAEARAKPPQDAQSKLFITKADQSAAAMVAALDETRIPVTDALHGHAIVSARFNDHYDAKLLVDTGASYISLPLATASRLKLEWKQSEKSRATLADGTKIDVYPTTIRKITVAGATLENVRAIVMPDAAGFEADGLLGMSFLREFDFQLDAANGEIKLRRLPPVK